MAMVAADSARALMWETAEESDRIDGWRSLVIVTKDWLEVTKLRVDDESWSAVLAIATAHLECLAVVALRKSHLQPI